MQLCGNYLYYQRYNNKDFTKFYKLKTDKSENLLISDDIIVMNGGKIVEQGEAKQVMASAKAVGGLHIITGTRQGLDANALRTMGDFLRDKDPAVVAVLASITGEKVSFLAVCGKEAVAKGIKAGELVKSVSAVCGGKGGGKPDSAMGGGTDLLKVDDALATVDDFVSAKLG